MVNYKIGIYKAVSRSRVDKSGESEKGFGNIRRVKGDSKRVGIGKSGCVESDNLHGCTVKSNAVLSLCGGRRTA